MYFFHPIYIHNLYSLFKSEVKLSVGIYVHKIKNLFLHERAQKKITTF